MKKKLVYNLGSEAGFFSEFNNMILAYLYCLKHNIEFVLYSKKANFAINQGWQDYFLPFCQETSDVRHTKYNIRLSCDVPSYSFLGKCKVLYFKISTRTDYLTCELWDKFHNRNFESESFYWDKMSLTTKEFAKIMIPKIWRYNKKTKEYVAQKIASLHLPQKYIGIHIRGGDKFLEADCLTIDKYMDFITATTNIKDMFILTDDYRIFQDLSERYSDFHFYTLCKPDAVGYFHSDFVKVDTKKKYDDLVNLFASVDVMSNADIFVGTYSSNIGMYLGMRMEQNKCFGIDMADWRIW